MAPRPKSKLSLFGLSQKHRAGSGLTHKVLTTNLASANKLLLEFLGKRGLSRGQCILELPRPILSELTLKPGVVTRVRYDPGIPLYWD